MTLGGTSKVSIEIENISTVEVGMQRLCELRIISSVVDFEARDLKFKFGDNEEKSLSEPYAFHLQSIPPKSAITIEGTIKMSESAGMLLETEFIVELYLQDPKSSENPHPCI